jgi:3-oxoadipate enol-lactonase
MVLAHDVSGDGPMVVLLHSTVCDRRMWDPQLPALTGAGYRVMRCDLPGFGESPMPDRPQSDAQDVLEVIDLLGGGERGGGRVGGGGVGGGGVGGGGVGVGGVALVAASGGGRVALEIAARWPDRITRLVLLATARDGFEPSAELRAVWDRENALLEAGDVAGATEFNVDTWLGPAADEKTRDFVRRMQGHAFEVQLAADEECEPLETETDPADITAPTLLIAGRHDLPDFRGIATDLAARIPGARTFELAWAGHLPSLERPDEVNPILLEFLGA